MNVEIVEQPRSPAQQQGDSWMKISSTSPALRACFDTEAPMRITSFSPAASRACATALSMPSLTKTNEALFIACGSRPSWVMTKLGVGYGVSFQWGSPTS